MPSSPRPDHHPDTSGKRKTTLMGPFLTTMRREILHPTGGQLLLSVACGIAAAATFFLSIEYALGGGMYLDPSEIFVTLGAALGGPIGGVIAGAFQGAVYAPGRNIPSHVIAGFLWGVWYLIIWQIISNQGARKILLPVLWILTMPVYYTLFLLPLNLGIHAVFIVQEPFIPFYLSFMPRVLPEIALTAGVSGVVIALVPEKYTNPDARADMDTPPSVPPPGGEE